MKNKRFAIVLDTGRCIDCKACTVACKAENDVPLGPENRRNWVEEELQGAYPNLKQENIPGQCMHCGEAPCNETCPTGATAINADGIVTVDFEKCIGCMACMEVCPYEARYYKEEADVVDKCTFCKHRVDEARIPACVETCPTKVRVFGDIKDPKSEASKLLAKNPTRVQQPEEGTKPHLFYIEKKKS